MASIKAARSSDSKTALSDILAPSRQLRCLTQDVLHFTVVAPCYYGNSWPAGLPKLQPPVGCTRPSSGRLQLRRTAAPCTPEQPDAQQQPGQWQQAGAPLQGSGIAIERGRLLARLAQHALFGGRAGGRDICQAIAVEVRQAADVVEHEKGTMKRGRIYL